MGRRDCKLASRVEEDNGINFLSSSSNKEWHVTKYTVKNKGELFFLCNFGKYLKGH